MSREKTRKPKTRANGEGSVYRLSDGRWRATKTAGFTGDGKQKIIAGSGPTREIAIERREASWRKWLVTSGQAPQSILKKELDLDKKTLTVGEWFYRWHAAFDTSTTKEHYRKQVLTRIDTHINPHFGNTPLPLLTSDDVEIWLRKTMPEKVRPDGKPLLAYGTITNIFSTLRLGLNEAVRKGHLKANPCLLVTPPKKQKVRPKIEQKKNVPLELLKLVHGRDDECFYLIKILYGMRISEVVGLTEDSFDVTARTRTPTLSVRTQLQRSEIFHGCGSRNVDGTYPCGQKTAGTCPKKVGESKWYLSPPKSEAGVRTLPLVDPALKAVIKQLNKKQAIRESPDFDPLPGLERLLFTTPTGRPITPNKAQTQWHALLAEAGMGYMRGHELRHLTATLLAESNVGLEVVQRILGHSEAAMSAYYTHVGLGATEKPLKALARHMTKLQRETGAFKTLPADAPSRSNIKK
jgi:integrase